MQLMLPAHVAVGSLRWRRAGIDAHVSVVAVVGVRSLRHGVRYLHSSRWRQAGFVGCLYL